MFNSNGHLKDRSGFLVALFGFCGFALGLQWPKTKKKAKMKRVRKKVNK